MRALALLALCLASLSIVVPGSARAATLEFTGTLRLQVAPPYLPPLTIPGAGSVQVADDGSFHLLSLLLPGGAFGPVSASLPTTSAGDINSVIFTNLGNLTGNFGGISGGPPGGGPMGLSGMAKICLALATPGCAASVNVPLQPVAGKGLGVGGTQYFPGAVSITMKHAPWTVGQPVMTIHSPNSNVTTPALPGGFVHGPASLTSSTALPSGTIQLVTVSKTYTSLTVAFPELPVIGVLQLHFVPEPGTALLLGSGVAALGVIARRRRRR
jgi:hypothetical protein